MDKEQAIKICKDRIKTGRQLIFGKSDFDDFCKQEYDAMEKLIELVENDWVHVEDRLPDVDMEYYQKNGEHKTFLVMLEYGTIPTTMHYNGEEWEEFSEEIFDFEPTEYVVTHWRKLPAPPKGEC